MMKAMSPVDKDLVQILFRFVGLKFVTCFKAWMIDSFSWKMQKWGKFVVLFIRNCLHDENSVYLCSNGYIYFMWNFTNHTCLIISTLRTVDDYVGFGIHSHSIQSCNSEIYKHYWYTVSKWWHQNTLDACDERNKQVDSHLTRGSILYAGARYGWFCHRKYHWLIWESFSESLCI
jgi:hypothetical protein